MGYYYPYPGYPALRVEITGKFKKKNWPKMVTHLLKNNAEGSVFKNIRSLRDENQFFDVTLMCDDGEIFSAHKVVLASQSEKFKLILSHMTMSQVSRGVCIVLALYLLVNSF